MNKEKFDQLAQKGLNCSQLVLAYFGEDYGLDMEIIKKIAKPFESGMCQGGGCGTVNAAYMVLGLAFANDEEDNRDLIISKVQEFNERFEKERGSIICEDLLDGLEVYKSGGLDKLFEEGKVEGACQPAMVTAIEILEDMI